ncbi:hypothetical protein GJ496_003820 [Pomphorhynchus laevis]|nr:hypothetical protein GJ496_003820 [Pomphorhynchus laevis]
MNLHIGDAEKIYLLHGIEEDLRVSGRTRQEFRHINIECNVDPSKMGSSKVTFEGTTVMVTVEATTRRLDIADQMSLLEGSLFLRVHFATCPVMGSDQDLNQLQLKIERLLFLQLKHLNKDQLCILSEKCVWDLHICVNVLQLNGNPCDISSVALLAALATTELPKLVICAGDDDLFDIELPDPVQVEKLNIAGIPIFVTIFKTGTNQIVDADMLEEAVSFSRLIVAINRNGDVVAVDKDGPGSLTIDSIESMIREAISSGMNLFKIVDESLKSKFLETEITVCTGINSDFEIVAFDNEYFADSDQVMVSVAEDDSEYMLNG